MSKLYIFNNKEIIAEASDTFIALLDGATIQTMDDFYKAIAQALHFPDYFGENLDALEEMLYDMDWIEHDFILLLIKNSEEIFQQNDALKNTITSLIQDIDNPYFEVAFL